MKKKLARQHHSFVDRMRKPAHSVLVAACLSAWTSNAPGGDQSPPGLPWSKPLSAAALEATSQSLEAAIVAPATSPVNVAVDSVEPGEAAFAPQTIPPVEASVTLAVEVDAPSPLEPYDAAFAPELLGPFEPPLPRFDELALASDALDPIAAIAYPAMLDEIAEPTALQQELMLAAAQQAERADYALKPAAVLLPELPSEFADAAPVRTTPSTANAAAEPAVVPQTVAAAVPSARLLSPPLSVPALGAVSAFDASRTMQRFEVKGGAALPRPVMDDALKSFIGAERTDDQLQAARAALQRAHDQAGHRVKVVLGEQRERDGVARFEVRERKRYSLRIAGDLRYDPVTRRNVRADTIITHDEPLTSLTLSRRLSLK